MPTDTVRESVRVVVLGSSGMLGAMVADYLARDPSTSVTATVRSAALAKRCAGLVSEIEWQELDIEAVAEGDLAKLLQAHDYAINAIGVIKPYIRDDSSEEVTRAIRVNALWPHLLARAASTAGVRVLQIATDCVYSGTVGRYREDAPHDPLDAYGKSKSLGEVVSDAIFSLRCSIIGPEARGNRSLLEWFLSQPAGTPLSGFTNHAWNGVTTLHFAKVCRGIMLGGLTLPSVLHLVPADVVTKAELLRIFAKHYGRDGEVAVSDVEAPVAMDRSLETRHPEVNAAVWRSASYAQPPTIEQMVAELQSFDFRLRHALQD